MKYAEYWNKMRTEWRHLAFWRDVLVEGLATFMLVSVQCALPLEWDQPGRIGGALQPGVCMGFIVCTMAWTLGDFSGGHMNPAVTFGMAVSTKVTVGRCKVNLGSHV